GTRFRVYLPRTDAVTEGAESQGVSVSVPRGSETVLLVEDEPAVRDLVRDFLRRNGYFVLVASAGDEALELAAKHRGTIHVVVTDVIMPRMNGRELVERLRRTYPHLRVLYVSGYSGNIIEGQGGLPPGTFFLQKPFSMEVVVRKLREVL